MYFTQMFKNSKIKSTVPIERYALVKVLKLSCASSRVVDPFPDPHWECGSGSRSKGTDQNLQIIPISSLSKSVCTYICMFYDLQMLSKFFM
jgi:hypothetical protein